MVTGLLSMEEIFETFFTISGHGGHLDQVTQLPQTNFGFGLPWRLPIKFRFNGPSGFRGEEFYNVGPTHGQQMPGYISSTIGKSSGELKFNE